MFFHHIEITCPTAAHGRWGALESTLISFVINSKRSLKVFSGYCEISASSFEAFATRISAGEQLEGKHTPLSSRCSSPTLQTYKRYDPIVNYINAKNTQITVSVPFWSSGRSWTSSRHFLVLSRPFLTRADRIPIPTFLMLNQAPS